MRGFDLDVAKADLDTGQWHLGKLGQDHGLNHGGESLDGQVGHVHLCLCNFLSRF